jgi:hypothetical protein
VLQMIYRDGCPGIHEQGAIGRRYGLGQNHTRSKVDQQKAGPFLAHAGHPLRNTDGGQCQAGRRSGKSLISQRRGERRGAEKQPTPFSHGGTEEHGGTEKIPSRRERSDAEAQRKTGKVTVSLRAIGCWASTISYLVLVLDVSPRLRVSALSARKILLAVPPCRRVSPCLREKGSWLFFDSGLAGLPFLRRDPLSLCWLLWTMGLPVMEGSCRELHRF